MTVGDDPVRVLQNGQDVPGAACMRLINQPGAKEAAVTQPRPVTFTKDNPARPVRCLYIGNIALRLP